MYFAGSSNRKRWLERSALTSEVAEETLSSRRKRHEAEPTDPEERRRKVLVVRGCLRKVQIVGGMLNYSQNLRLTAMAYIKRYFEVEPLQGNDLAVMVLTAYYLAGKVEEELGKGMQLDKRGVNMKDLCDAVKTKKRSAEEYKTAAIRNEMKFLVGLNFDLLCFHPLRSASALWVQLREKMQDEKLFETSKSHIASRCEECYLVGNLIFEYPHSFLGAVVVCCVIRNGAFEDGKKTELLDELRKCIVQIPSAKDIKLDQITAVADILEQGLAKGKAEEAESVYMDYIKRGTLSPPSS